MGLKINLPKLDLSKVKTAVQNAGSSIKTGAQNAGNAVQTGAQNAGSSIKTGVKTVSTKTVEAAKKVATAAANTAKKVVNGADKAASIVLFAPLRPLAVIFLKRKGITPGKTNEEIIAQVYNQISKKSFGYAGPDLFDFEADPSEADSFTYGFALTSEIVVSVITFLSTIFASIKAKKASGEPLSKEESDVLDNAPAIEKGLSDAAAAAKEIVGDAAVKADEIQEKGAADALGIISGEGGMSKGLIITIVLVIIVLIYFFMRKK